MLIKDKDLSDFKSLQKDIPIDDIRKDIIENLVLQGFKINDNKLISEPQNLTKERIRHLHKNSYIQKILHEKEFIKKNFAKLSCYFAHGSLVDPDRFSPALHIVQSNSEYSDLFRLATLLWSIPVSQGFGRRTRFLVFDKHNGKLVGLFALGDPVFNLHVRDMLIGWDHKIRVNRLYHVKDLFIVGAVPPYSQLLCSKLMAMLSTTNEVRKIIYQKYKGNITTINQNVKEPHLVLLTTSSALGRSSIFNRIKFKENPLFFLIGETAGWGHFHLSNGSYKLMREFLTRINHPINKSNRFGQGPNWKIRTIRTSLELLGLSPDLLFHSIKRHVYIAPLAKNYINYLLEKSNKPKYHDIKMTEIIDFFKQRWMIPRAVRFPEFRKLKAIDTLKEIKKIAGI